MNQNIFRITMRRKNAFVLSRDIVCKESTEETEKQIDELVSCIRPFGYDLDECAKEVLLDIHPIEIVSIRNELIQNICELKGIDKKMIENKKSKMKKKDKFDSFKDDPLVNLSILTNKEVQEMASNLLRSKVVLSETDKDDIAIIFDTYKNFDLFPEEIPMKENMAFVTQLTYSLFGSVEFVVPYIKTATDVLRVITAISNGDISLSSKTKYVSLKRKDRKQLLDCLNKAPNLEEDMFRHASKWKKVGEMLHPGEYKAAYPLAFEAFKKIRENEKVTLFMGGFHNLCNAGDYEGAAVYLSQRPGELARKMDYLIRSAADKAFVIETFSKVADKVDSPLLVQLYGHFKYRNNLEYKMVMPKSTYAKYYLLKNEVQPIDSQECDQMVEVIEGAIMRRLSEKGPIGKVYLSEDVKGCMVPSSMRSASKALKTLARGSRFKLEEKTKCIKLFCYWKNSELDDYGTDIDLSAVFYNEDFSKQLDLYYGNTRSEFANHSGDILTAPVGDWEFIDIDIDKAIEAGYRYMAMSVNNFNCEPFNKLPECFAGWAEVKSIDRLIDETIDEPSGDVSDIKNKFDIASASLTTVPMILDLKAREIIWADTDINSSALDVNNVESNKGSIEHIMKGIIETRKMDLYELFLMNVKAREGELVSKKEEADIVFSLNEGITPFDYEKIMSDFI